MNWEDREVLKRIADALEKIAKWGDPPKMVVPDSVDPGALVRVEPGALVEIPSTCTHHRLTLECSRCKMGIKCPAPCRRTFRFRPRPRTCRASYAKAMKPPASSTAMWLAG